MVHGTPCVVQPLVVSPISFVIQTAPLRPDFLCHSQPVMSSICCCSIYAQANVCFVANTCVQADHAPVQDPDSTCLTAYFEGICSVAAVLYRSVTADTVCDAMHARVRVSGNQVGRSESDTHIAKVVAEGSEHSLAVFSCARHASV